MLGTNPWNIFDLDWLSKPETFYSEEQVIHIGHYGLVNEIMSATPINENSHTFVSEFA